MVYDWKERAIARRDERQTKAPAIRKPGGAKRDTKKWCRGIVGREHKLRCVSYDVLKNAQPIATATWSKDWRVLVCETCGKQLDEWWPNPLWRSPKPDWVVDTHQTGGC